MSAFVSGALSALNRVLRLLDIVDPDMKDEEINTLRTQIILYKQMYQEIDNYRTDHAIKNETWEKIKKTCTPEQAEDLEKVRAVFEKK